MNPSRVFGLPHLSEDAVAAYADGVLAPAAAIRAERHCLECAECAEAVGVQREAATMLRTASAPSLPSGLFDRLSSLPMSASMPPPFGGLPTAVGADGVPVFVSHRKAPAPDQPQAGRSMRRAALPLGVFASAAAVVAAGAVGASLGSSGAGGPQQNAPAVVAPAVFSPLDAATTVSPTTSPTTVELGRLRPTP